MKKYLTRMVVTGLLSAPALAQEFTCQLENNKYVSVVVEKGKTPAYRYGTLAKPEITLPVKGNAKNGVYVGQTAFIGGGSAYIRFENGPFNYVVYSGMGRGWEFTGLAVYKGDKVINKKVCKTDLGIYDVLNYGLPEDESGEIYAMDPNSQ